MSYELVKQDEINALKTEITPLLNYAKELVVIENGNQYRQAGEGILSLKRAVKIVKDKLDPIKNQAYASYKGISNLEAEFLLPLEAGIKSIGMKLIVFEDKEKSKQREAQLKADAITRAEQKKLEDARLKQAQKAEDKGDTELAESLMETPVIVPVMKVESNIPKVNGLNTRKNWKAEVIDKDLVPDEYWVINQQALDGLARATKGTMTIPGVRFYEETVIVGRT